MATNPRRLLPSQLKNNMQNTVIDNQFTGKILPGIPLTDNIFMGSYPLNAFNHFGLKRPSVVEKATQKELNGDEHLRAAYNVRSQVQRRFDAPRLRRAQAYAEYLQSIYTGERIGGFPPITLFCPQQGEVSPDGHSLVLDFEAALVNLDGETQTEARFILRQNDPETDKIPVPFILYHGISEEHAAAIMHDVNFYAKPVAEQKIAVLNSSGQLTRVVNEALRKADIQPGQITRLSPRPRKNHVVAYAGLIAGAAGALTGRTISNNLPGQISKLNNYPEGAQADKAKPFLDHALKLVSQIGTCKPVIWALMGGHYHDTGDLLPATAWLKVAAAYEEAKFERGTPQQAALKREAAFAAIDVKL